MQLFQKKAAEQIRNVKVALTCDPHGWHADNLNPLQREDILAGIPFILTDLSRLFAMKAEV